MPTYDSNAQDWQFFTPVHDLILQHYNDKEEREVPSHVLYGLVFGKIFRYCQAYAVCFAALDTMAEEVGLSERTFRRALGDLLEDSLVYVYKRPGHTDVYTIEPMLDEKVEELLQSAFKALGRGLTVQGARTHSPTSADSQSDEQSIKESIKQTIFKDGFQGYEET